MDEELRAYLEAMEARLLASFNVGQERILNRMASLEGDFQNTKGFLINDAVISGRRWLDLEARVSSLEKGNGNG